MKKTKSDVFIGKTVGPLTINRYADGRTPMGTKLFDCTCICGKNRIIGTERILAFKNKGCLCKFANRGKYNPGYSNSESRALTRICRYKASAKVRGYSYLLTEEEAKFLILSKCFYCGYLNEINGIDRVNNSLGYIKENCVPCCTQCNGSKSDQDVSDFIQYLDRIVKFRASQSLS